MIIQCGHIFCSNELLTWFENNVRCPMCRFDIRTYSVPLYSSAIRIPLTNSESINDPLRNYEINSITRENNSSISSTKPVNDAKGPSIT